MNRIMMEQTQALENGIFACFGAQMDNELPQIAGEDELALELFQENTHLSRETLMAKLYGKYDA
jgi:hypothetical protein